MVNAQFGILHSSVSAMPGAIRWAEHVLAAAGFRVLWGIVMVVALCGIAPGGVSLALAESPAEFVEQLWPEARALGVSRQNFNDALAGFSPDPKVTALTKKQSEFVRPIWSYIDGALSKARVDRGQRQVQQWGKTIAMIEKVYGVPRAVFLGIWGMESNFDSHSGNTPTIRALATLAYERYRGDFFRQELLQALVMVEEDHLDPAMMVGSWAGAMGQTQFMPSSYRKYAVDYDRDGIRNIWSSVPDSLASTANYLRQHGWEPGLPWGFEVILPEGFSYKNYRHDFVTWSKLGVRRADNRTMPQRGEARLFAPAGRRGPVFLLTGNFDVIKEYNTSDAYALGVALLGERLTGATPLHTSWPRNEATLTHDQRVEVQRRLATLGFYDGKIDGKHGTGTREAVRQFQLKTGLTADGYADVDLLNALRKAR